MVAIKGHFDGKVIVPDEPLQFTANQRLILHIEPVQEREADFREWLGLGLRAPPNPNPQFKIDDDPWR